MNNKNQVLEENIDYVYNNNHKILKFYDEDPINICSQLLNESAKITIRWGKPKLYVED